MFKPVRKRIYRNREQRYVRVCELVRQYRGIRRGIDADIDPHGAAVCDRIIDQLEARKRSLWRKLTGGNQSSVQA